MAEAECENVRPKKVPKWVKAYLAALCRVGVRGHAAELAGIAYETARRYRGENPDFVTAEGLAMDEAADRLEREAVRRAHDGVEKPVFGKLEKYDVLEEGAGGAVVTYTGEVGRIREYSDTLLIFLLKGARPDKFADRQKRELSGAVSLVSAELADRIAAARAARAATPPPAPPADPDAPTG